MSFSSVVRSFLRGEAKKRLPAKNRNRLRQFPLTLEILETRNLLDAGLMAGTEVYGDQSTETSVVDQGTSMYDSTFSDTGSESNMYPSSPEDGSNFGEYPSDGGYSGPGGTSPGDYGGSDSVGLPFYEITAISPDLGLSNNDFVTSTGQLTVLGTGNANTSFQLVIDSVDEINVTVGGDGKWSVALPKTLSEGMHSLATQTDGFYYAMQYVMIDLTAPEISLTAPEFTNKAEATLTVEMDSEGDYLPPSEFSIDVDLDGDGKYTSAGELDFYQGFFFPGEQQVILPELPEGTFQLRARLEDGAGNTALSQTATMQVDPNSGFIGSQPLLDLYRDYQELIGGGGQYGGYDYPGSPPGGDEGSGEFSTGDDGSDSTSDGDGNTPGPNLDELKSRYYLRFDSQDRVGVNVRATLTKYVDDLKKDLMDKLKMEVVWVEKAQNMITGYLPIDQIMALEQLDNFSAVTPLYKPVLKTGSVEGQADSPINADVFRTQFGSIGTGIKVGVLSDSVDAVAGGLADSVASGDLPSNVQVLQDLAGGTDEGRAMLEIIHDIAPGASLAFHSAAISPQNFANGVLALQAAGAKVITDDVGYANQPFFNDGVVSQAADLATARGAIFTSAAGNFGDLGWTSSFTGTTTTIGSGGTTVTGTFLDLGGGDVLQDFTLAVGETAIPVFQWSSAFLEGGSPLANFQVNTDIDVYVTNAAGTTILATINTNNLNTDEAVEGFMFLNNGSFGTNNFALAFHLRTGPAPARVRWINFAGNDIQAQQQGGPTIWAQTTAKTVIAAGAVPWFDPTTPESFTSFGGGMEFFFDAAGTPLASPEIRFKPEVSAPDGLNTTFFGSDISQDSDTLPNFFGTSAATPVVAGAIALLLSQAVEEGDYTAAEVTRHLKRTALDIGLPGEDGYSGAGLIQLTPLPKRPKFEEETILNDTSDRATNLGTLSGSISQIGQTIFRHNNGLFDYDWYQFTAGTGGTLTVNLSNIQTFGGGDLHFRVFVLEGGALREIGSSRITGGSETQSLSVSVSAGQRIFLWVYGFNFEQGAYDLDVNLR